MNIVAISNSRLCSESYPPRELIFFFFFNKNRFENYSGTAKQIYKRLSTFYKFASVFTWAVSKQSHISECNGTFVETNTAIMAWKIADIITLSHCVTIEVFCAKLQGSSNTVCYHKGIMYWRCTRGGITNTVSALPLKSSSEGLVLHPAVFPGQEFNILNYCEYKTLFKRFSYFIFTLYQEKSEVPI